MADGFTASITGHGDETMRLDVLAVLDGLAAKYPGMRVEVAATSEPNAASLSRPSAGDAFYLETVQNG